MLMNSCIEFHLNGQDVYFRSFTIEMWRLSSQVSVYVWSPVHFSVVRMQAEITFTYILSYSHEPSDHVTIHCKAYSPCH